MASSTHHAARTLSDLEAIRAQVADIIPGGRDPERSYHAKHEALRGLDRLIRGGR